MGSFFFFFTPLFSVLCLGPGAVRMSWPPGRGLGCWFSLLLRGPGWSSCPRAGVKGVSAPGSGADYPSGVVVPGSRSIECIWGVWVWVPCPFCVSTFGARVCIFVCVHEGGNVCLCIWVLVRLRLCVRSGLRLHLTHHLSRPPPHHHALPVEDAAGALVVSRAGAGCSGERRPTLGGRLAGPGPTGLAGPDWGWGAFGSPGPGPGLPWCGRLPVEPAGLPPRHPGASALWLSEVTPSGSPLPFSGWRPRLSLRWFSWGSRVLGGPRMFGARIFPCLLHALRDGAVVPTHTIKHLHGGTLWTQARSHTQVYTQAFTLV